MRTALGIVYDEASKKIMVLNEYGAIDITRFFTDFTIRDHNNKVSCDIDGTLRATVNPDMFE